MPFVFSASSVSTLLVRNYCCPFLLWRNFSIRLVFLLIIHSGTSVSIYFDCHFIVNGKLFKPVSMFVIMARRFPIWYILSAAWSESWCIFALGSSSSSPWKSFFHSAFLLCSLPSHILPQDCFVSLPFGKSSKHSPSKIRKISLSLFWNVLCCVYCFILSRYLFIHWSFASTFWFIFSNFIIHCVAFLFVSTYALNIVACCHRFLIGVSSLIFLPSLWVSIHIL